MKLYVKAFLAHNIGDDLFIQSLVNKYKNHKFYAISNGFSYNNYSNLKVFSNKFMYRIIRKFKLEKYIANRCERTITIGGRKKLKMINIKILHWEKINTIF